MISQENRLFCRLDGLTTEAREQQRLQAIAELGLLEIDSVAVFDEAVQTATQVLNTPISWVGLMEADRERVRSAVGLTRLGIMNELATTRQISRLDAFCSHVVDSHQPLIINDTLSHPALSSSILVCEYGIRAYLGVPLVTLNGNCIGTLAAMDLMPRAFTPQDCEFLQVLARWVVSEYERQQLSHQPASVALSLPTPQTSIEPPVMMPPVNQVKVELLSHMVQELRTPLTSVMGMASVLMRENYLGALTGKQKEYLGIIHNSGQYLLSLVNEILELSELKGGDRILNLAPIDIEMLSQQAINTLEQAAHRREQEIRLTVEPGRRIWLLDKEKVRQMIYHLVFSVIQSSTAGSIVRIHISRKSTILNIAVWVSHPWLGEGLPYAEIQAKPSLVGVVVADDVEFQAAGEDAIARMDADSNDLENGDVRSHNSPGRANLGLALSRQLAEIHGGQIQVQGGVESGYRYVISLPQMSETGMNP